MALIHQILEFTPVKTKALNAPSTGVFLMDKFHLPPAYLVSSALLAFVVDEIQRAKYPFEYL
jgi:hypothetical protein